MTGAGENLPPSPADQPASRWWDRALFAVIIGTIATAIAVIVLTARVDRFPASDFTTLGVLVGTAIAYDLVARRIESIRRRTSVGPYVTMGSVWTLCSALLLPVALSAVLVTVLYVQEEIQARLADNPKPAYRVLFNIAAVVIPCAVVHHIVETGGAMRLLDGSPVDAIRPLLLLGALLAYTAINTVFIGLVLTLATRRFSARVAIGSVGENVLEAATLSLGALVALAMTVDLWFVLLAVPVMSLLARIALVEHLESAASEDSKTGLLNSAAWQHVAERELARAIARHAPAAVVLIDLDHFKRVNDTYGHLTGDAVLRAVADCMAGMLRDRDLLSRFGGEEFVALLPDADGREALRVAERLRARIADVVVTQVGDPPQAVLTEGDPLAGQRPLPGPERIGVTVSVGIAAFPDHGQTLTVLLAKADAALYDAKHAGRNRVRMSA